jgi:hypothetical protein
MAKWNSLIRFGSGRLLMVLLLGWVMSPLNSVGGYEWPETPVAPVSLTGEQLRLVMWAEGRFDEAGLELPEVRYVFYDNPEPCNWRRGRYHPASGLVEICSFYEDTLIHELAHAWAEANLTVMDKEAFAASRGLANWNDPSSPWNERGTEHAAEVIAWGVEERNRLVPSIGSDPSDAYRLPTIPNSNPRELMAAYEILTGTPPVLRDPSDWTRGETDVTSPEAIKADVGSGSRVPSAASDLHAAGEHDGR